MSVLPTLDPETVPAPVVQGTGELVYQVVRLEWIEDGERKKSFFQRRPDPEKPSAWINNLEGISHGLYRLPELREAGADDVVYLPEGEKDVETLIAFGLVATTNSGGAKNWRQDHAEALRGRDVVITIDNDPAGRGVLGNGAVSGGFGFAGLALAVVSLTTNWTSGIVVSRGQYSAEMNAPSSGLTVQQELNLYANGWHTQGWWALVFAAAAVLFGAGALLWPRIRRSGRTPGWAKAVATGAIIVGLVGALLAVLTITGVFGGHLTAPTSAG